MLFNLSKHNKDIIRLWRRILNEYICLKCQESTGRLMIGNQSKKPKGKPTCRLIKVNVGASLQSTMKLIQ